MAQCGTVCPALTALTGASRGIRVRSEPFRASRSLTASVGFFFRFLSLFLDKSVGVSAEGAETGAQSGSGLPQDMLRG